MNPAISDETIQLNRNGANPGSANDEISSFGFDVLDTSSIPWERVDRVAYLVRQQFRYDYPGPIRNLHQRLIVIPPERHGDQRLVMHKIEVSSLSSSARREIDRFGNLVHNISIDRVEEQIDFTSWIVVERSAGMEPHWVDPREAEKSVWREPTPLTEPDSELRFVARQLIGESAGASDLAHRINELIYRRMTYESGTTTVETSASEAFALGAGVCQDFAHIMLALCREAGLPARYVSGHLLGEGATHAWVEVFLPDPERPGRTVSVPFDPTHGKIAGFNYVTVAVGRDFRDVTPTSGNFWAPYPGRLTASKLAGALAVDYRNLATPEPS
jgi:transglutaminase-like putative cysteine protease